MNGVYRMERQPWRASDTVVVLFFLACIGAAIMVARTDRKAEERRAAEIAAAGHPYRCRSVDWTFEAIEGERPMLVRWHWMIYRGDMFVADKYASEPISRTWMQRSPQLWREWGFLRGAAIADSAAKYGP